MIRAIFLDLDGTLVDCADLHYEALNRALEASFFAPIEREEHLRIFNGLPTKAKLERLVKEGHIPKHAMAEIAILKQRFTADMAPAHVVPDSIKVEMCAALAGRYRLAVVSNCVRASVGMLLMLAGLSEYFEFTVSNQDVEHAKPAPDPYLLAFRMMAGHIDSQRPLHKNETLVIEDNEKGVWSAQATGLEVVQLQYPYITLEVMRAVIAAAERKMAQG